MSDFDFIKLSERPRKILDGKSAEDWLMAKGMQKYSGLGWCYGDRMQVAIDRGWLQFNGTDYVISLGAHMQVGYYKLKLYLTKDIDKLEIKQDRTEYFTNM